MKYLVDAVNEQRRAHVACLRGFSLWRLYNEKEAARFIGCHYATLQRRRLMGEVTPTQVEGIRYLGVMIADIILSEIDKEPDATKNG